MSFFFNSQEHLSSCEYKASYCDHCKQLAVLHEHENYCPEMPVSCVRCSKVLIRKKLQVSVISHLLILFIQISRYDVKVTSFQSNIFCGNFCCFQKVV